MTNENDPKSQDDVADDWAQALQEQSSSGMSGDFAAGAATGFFQRHQPIHTDAFGAAGGQLFKIRRIAFAE